MLIISSILPFCMGGTTATTTGTTSGQDEFGTCHTCQQVHEPLCVNYTMIETQCGSEDWTGGSYIGCRDFFLDTYTCSTGTIVHRTRQHDEPKKYCQKDEMDAATAACTM